ncbi:DUF917-domain-containing protein [Acephala macrosclerotiorum]|nr:DUF917-domain-containing protein [Acephala macrosclerotiorum]
MYRVGVDVGGTNTDCAILDLSQPTTPSRGVLVSSKTPTTVDITSGIIHVVEDVLSKSQVEKSRVLSVTIGTTHFVNAVVEADERGLSKVAVVRLCGPSTRHTPPFADYPLGLRRIMKGPIYYLDGGLEIDGREIMPLNVKEIEETAKDIEMQGITKVALVGVFSPLDHSGMREERCKKILLESAPSLDIVCSHTIGGVGLLERENATILNASILAVAQKTVSGFKKAMSKLKLSCPLYLTQNDGTLTEADDAVKLPVKTFASGPTNSMTGAAFLAGLDGTRSDTSSQFLVVDIGGTTIGICALLPSGFPRQAPNFVEVGDVRTAFSMPDVFSVGLGGGSRVDVDDVGKVTVGPDSVGHYLTTRALVFGGKIMTSTDTVVSSGKEKSSADPNSHRTMTKPSLDIDIATYRPEVRDKIWYFSEVDLEFIACGTGILGTGGGGPSYLAYLVALDALRAGGEKMRVISPEHLNDDDPVCFGSWYGAPSVSGERLSAGTEIPAAIDALNKIMGVKEFYAFLADEIGGGNGLATFPASVHYDRPTVDGDKMGRAYPSMEHGTPYVYGHPIAPCAMADAKGNVSVVMGAESNARLEKMLRATCIELGLKISVVARPLPGSVIKDFVVSNTVSQSWYLGRAVHLARRTKASYVKEIFNVILGRELFSGKAVDVRRDVSKGGYTVGRCLLAPLSDGEIETENTTVEKQHLLIPFQNEFLYAAYTDEKGQHETEVICTVPDLISVLGEDGKAIGGVRKICAHK